MPAAQLNMRVRLAPLRAWPLLQKAVLDRLPYPILYQSLGHVRDASPVSSELGQLVQILPSCHSKGHRSAVRISMNVGTRTGQQLACGEIGFPERISSRRLSARNQRQRVIASLALSITAFG